MSRHSWKPGRFQPPVPQVNTPQKSSFNEGNNDFYRGSTLIPNVQLSGFADAGLHPRSHQNYHERLPNWFAGSSGRGTGDIVRLQARFQASSARESHAYLPRIPAISPVVPHQQTRDVFGQSQPQMRMPRPFEWRTQSNQIPRSAAEDNTHLQKFGNNAHQQELRDQPPPPFITAQQQMLHPTSRTRFENIPPMLPVNFHHNTRDQRMPFLPQGGFQGLSSFPVTPQNATQNVFADLQKKESDKEFVSQWLANRKIEVENVAKDKKEVKLHKFRNEVQEYLKCIEELKTCRNVLLHFANTDDENWREIVNKTESIKETLEAMQKNIFQNDCIIEVVEKIKKRLKKRERQRNARERRAKEKVEHQRRTFLLHQKIDDWRHKIVSDINAKKMVDSLKSEAGQSLTEVRKKIADCTKCLEKVEGLVELRGIRRQTALQRGIFIFGDQDEKFKKRMDGMKDILKKRLELYKDEEKTLLVMLEEEKEQRQREDDTKRKELMEKEHLRLFGYNPVLECRRYWLQAEENPISLVQIRRLWDVYLVPDTIPGADRIPDGWVIPEINKNSSWSKYLKKNK